ncbi:MAG: hypothetical protein AB1485_03265 [Candidatus Thermoplasmatota archaeon]
MYAPPPYPMPAPPPHLKKERDKIARLIIIIVLIVVLVPIIVTVALSAILYFWVSGIAPTSPPTPYIALSSPIENKINNTYFYNFTVKEISRDTNPDSVTISIGSYGTVDVNEAKFVYRLLSSEVYLMWLDEDNDNMLSRGDKFSVKSDRGIYYAYISLTYIPTNGSMGSTTIQ